MNKFVTMNRLRAISRAAGTAMLALGFVRLPALAGQQPEFTGIWERNEKESDDPKAKFQAAFEGMHGPPGGGRPGAGGFSGQGRPEGPMRGGQGRPGGPMGPPGNLSEIVEKIETTLKDDEFHVAPVGGSRVSIFYLDGKKHTRETPRGGKIETRSEKKGDQITVVEKAEQGPEVTTTYTVAPDGNRMVVTVRFQGKQLKEPVVIRTVYDSVSVSS